MVASRGDTEMVDFFIGYCSGHFIFPVLLKSLWPELDLFGGQIRIAFCVDFRSFYIGGWIESGTVWHLICRSMKQVWNFQKAADNPVKKQRLNVEFNMELNVELYDI